MARHCLGRSSDVNVVAKQDLRVDHIQQLHQGARLTKVNIQGVELLICKLRGIREETVRQRLRPQTQKQLKPFPATSAAAGPFSMRVCRHLPLSRAGSNRMSLWHAQCINLHDFDSNGSLQLRCQQSDIAGRYNSEKSSMGPERDKNTGQYPSSCYIAKKAY